MSPSSLSTVEPASSNVLLVRDGEGQYRPASAEEVLHPEGSTTEYADPSALAAAVAAKALVSLPDDPSRYGFRLDPLLGQFAARSRSSLPGPRIWPGYARKPKPTGG